MTRASGPIKQLDSATEAVDEASMHVPYSAMKILFPAGHDGEADIRSGFKGPAHAIASADFTPENLHAHDLIVPLTVSDLRRLDDLRDLVDGNPSGTEPGKHRGVRRQAAPQRGADREWVRRCVSQLGIFHAYPYILKERIDA